MHEEGWQCPTCANNEDTNCVCCDMCDLWYHYECVDITKTPTEKYWYCPGCSTLPAIEIFIELINVDGYLKNAQPSTSKEGSTESKNSSEKENSETTETSPSKPHYIKNDPRRFEKFKQNRERLLSSPEKSQEEPAEKTDFTRSLKSNPSSNTPSSTKPRQKDPSPKKTQKGSIQLGKAPKSAEKIAKKTSDAHVAKPESSNGLVSPPNPAMVNHCSKCWKLYVNDEKCSKGGTHFTKKSHVCVCGDPFWNIALLKQHQRVCPKALKSPPASNPNSSYEKIFGQPLMAFTLPEKPKKSLVAAGSPQKTSTTLHNATKSIAVPEKAAKTPTVPQKPHKLSNPADQENQKLTSSAHSEMQSNRLKTSFDIPKKLGKSPKVSVDHRPPQKEKTDEKVPKMAIVESNKQKSPTTRVEKLHKSPNKLESEQLTSDKAKASTETISREPSSPSKPSASSMGQAKTLSFADGNPFSKHQKVKICHRCNKIFPSLDKLKQDRKNGCFHNGYDGYECPGCKRGFTKTSIMGHLRRQPSCYEAFKSKESSNKTIAKDPSNVTASFETNKDVQSTSTANLNQIKPIAVDGQHITVKASLERSIGNATKTSLIKSTQNSLSASCTMPELKKIANNEQILVNSSKLKENQPSKIIIVDDENLDKKLPNVTSSSKNPQNEIFIDEPLDDPPVLGRKDSQYSQEYEVDPDAKMLQTDAEECSQVTKEHENLNRESVQISVGKLPGDSCQDEEITEKPDEPFDALKEQASGPLNEAIDGAESSSSVAKTYELSNILKEISVLQKKKNDEFLKSPVKKVKEHVLNDTHESSTSYITTITGSDQDTNVCKLWQSLHVYPTTSENFDDLLLPDYVPEETEFQNFEIIAENIPGNVLSLATITYQVQEFPKYMVLNENFGIFPYVSPDKRIDSSERLSLCFEEAMAKRKVIEIQKKAAILSEGETSNVPQMVTINPLCKKSKTPTHILQHRLKNKVRKNFMKMNVKQLHESKPNKKKTIPKKADKPIEEPRLALDELDSCQKSTNSIITADDDPYAMHILKLTDELPFRPLVFAKSSNRLSQKSSRREPVEVTDKEPESQLSTRKRLAMIQDKLLAPDTKKLIATKKMLKKGKANGKCRWIWTKKGMNRVKSEATSKKIEGVSSKPTTSNSSPKKTVQQRTPPKKSNQTFTKDKTTHKKSPWKGTHTKEGRNTSPKNPEFKISSPKKLKLTEKSGAKKPITSTPRKNASEDLDSSQALYSIQDFISAKVNKAKSSSESQEISQLESVNGFHDVSSSSEGSFLYEHKQDPVDEVLRDVPVLDYNQIQIGQAEKANENSKNNTEICTKRRLKFIGSEDIVLQEFDLSVEVQSSTEDTENVSKSDLNDVDEEKFPLLAQYILKWNQEKGGKKAMKSLINMGVRPVNSSSPKKNIGRSKKTLDPIVDRKSNALDGSVTTKRGRPRKHSLDGETPKPKKEKIVIPRATSSGSRYSFRKASEHREASKEDREHNSPDETKPLNSEELSNNSAAMTANCSLINEQMENSTPTVNTPGRRSAAMIESVDKPSTSKAGRQRSIFMGAQFDSESELQNEFDLQQRRHDELRNQVQELSIKITTIRDVLENSLMFPKNEIETRLKEKMKNEPTQTSKDNVDVMDELEHNSDLPSNESTTVTVFSKSKGLIFAKGKSDGRINLIQGNGNHKKYENETIAKKSVENTTTMRRDVSIQTLPTPLPFDDRSKSSSDTFNFPASTSPPVPVYSRCHARKSAPPKLTDGATLTYSVP